MVAPIAPDGGWKKWFLDHPYQHTKYPVLRSPSVYAIHYGVSEGPEPFAEPQFEYVEMWYESKNRKVYASLNGQPPDWLWFGPMAPEAQWDDGVRDLFDHCMDLDGKRQTPPEPSGSGWDDFDWSI